MLTEKTIRMEPGESREHYVKRALAWCKKDYAKCRAGNGVDGSYDIYCHCSHTANGVLNACEDLFVDLGTFGTEGFCDDIGSDGVSYLNTGEAYDLTIAFRSGSERWYLTNQEALSALQSRFDRGEIT